MSRLARVGEAGKAELVVDQRSNAGKETLPPKKGRVSMHKKSERQKNIGKEVKDERNVGKREQTMLQRLSEGQTRDGVACATANSRTPYRLRRWAKLHRRSQLSKPFPA